MEQHMEMFQNMPGAQHKFSGKSWGHINGGSYPRGVANVSASRRSQVTSGGMTKTRAIQGGEAETEGGGGSRMQDDGWGA